MTVKQKQQDNGLMVNKTDYLIQQNNSDKIQVMAQEQEVGNIWTILRKFGQMVFYNQVRLKLLMLLPKDNNFHGMHTPKNAILTDWEMEAAMIVLKRVFIQGMRDTRDKYHGNAAMIVSLGTL